MALSVYSMGRSTYDEKIWGEAGNMSGGSPILDVGSCIKGGR
jgi:hypothetical protein